MMTIDSAEGALRLERTYEELKQKEKEQDALQWFMFRAYLWGIETKEKEQDAPPVIHV